MFANVEMSVEQQAPTYAAHPELIDSRVKFLCGAFDRSHADLCDEGHLVDGWAVGDQSSLPQRKVFIDDESDDDFENEADQMLFIAIAPELKIKEVDQIHHIQDDIGCLYEQPPRLLIKDYKIKGESVTVEFDPSAGEIPVELGPTAQASRPLHREFVGSIRATRTIDLGKSVVKEQFDMGPDVTRQTFFRDQVA